jgi:metallo-beta-lactamase family protein
MSVKLEFFGAAQTVTGSCTLISNGKRKILIDCGMKQEAGSQSMSGFPFDVGSIDAVVLTHGHLDHSGMIPSLFQNGYRGPVITHYATAELAQVIWEDMISQRNADPIFDRKSLEATVKSFSYVDYEEQLNFADVKFTFYDAGHILGSSHAVLEFDNKRLLFSGDIGAKNTPIINDPHMAWNEPFDTVVIESTYGNRTHKNREQTLAEFNSLIKRTVENRGVILIPAFAIGRTQEVIYHLNTLEKNGVVPSIPVIIDSPMAIKVTKIYKSYTVCYDDEICGQIADGDNPLDFRGLHFVSSHDESQGIGRMQPPFIVIAGSGMCNGGRILNHLKTFIGSSHTTVMFVGWQGKGTLGRELVDGAKSITIDGEAHPVHASIATLNGFSAHADRPALLEWASNIPGAPRWFVNHGEADAAQSLAGGLTEAGRGEAVAVRSDECYEI